MLFSTKYIGLERLGSNILAAEWEYSGQHSRLVKLTDNLELPSLHSGHPVVVTAIEAEGVLIRSLQIPLTKDKDIKEALAFQAEPLLPYPIEEAILAYQTIEKDAEGSTILLFSVRKNHLQDSLSRWEAAGIDPEQVTAMPVALAAFGQKFLPDHQSFVILHRDRSSAMGALILRGHLHAAYSGSAESPMRILLALQREVPDGTLEGFVLTGEGADGPSLSELTRLPLLSVTPAEPWSHEEIQRCALPIGLGLAAMPKATSPVDFRQGEFRYSKAWKRLAQPLALFLGLMVMFSFSLYFLGQSYLKHSLHDIKQEYLQVLASTGRSYDQFEQQFDAKPIEELTAEELDQRIAFLYKDIQATPDSFPLLPNIPRVSDVLAWLATHPTVVQGGEQNIQLEGFNYTLVKRPMQGKKQDKYQVKIDLEISATSPKAAREFHDALIAPNDWIDPKSEIKWGVNKNRYKTSFFLKDKTVYPSA